jgi:hypothetical protein
MESDDFAAALALHGEHRLARDIGNGRLEVLRDGLPFITHCRSSGDLATSIQAQADPL